MMNLKLSDRHSSNVLWQDRDVRFDVSSKELLIKDSEQKIRTFFSVEDTKGNTGDYGRLTLTNLRLIWQSKTKTRINLTIGYNAISSISKKNFHSELRGFYNSLHLLCKISGTRFEFIFTQFNLLNEPVNLTGEKGDLIYWITAVCKAYVESKLYRDLKLRSVLFTPNKQLKILPGEQIYDKIQGVWNLSSDTGNLGTMHLTDKRIVWVANLNELFNFSLPYIQISSIKIRESKFGLALVLESSETSGGYVLGFRIDPPDRLQKVYNALSNLFNVHKKKPDYGVEKLLQREQLEILDKQSGDAQPAEPTVNKSVGSEEEFVEEVQNVNPDVIASYLTDDETKATTKEKERLVYSSELGLTIEAVKEGFTLDELWNVVNNSS